MFASKNGHHQLETWYELTPNIHVYAMNDASFEFWNTLSINGFLWEVNPCQLKIEFESFSIAKTVDTTCFEIQNLHHSSHKHGISAYHVSNWWRPSLDATDSSIITFHWKYSSRFSGVIINIFIAPKDGSFDNQNYSAKRPVDDGDGYGGETKKMRVEAGEGPSTLLRILCNSKVSYNNISPTSWRLRCQLFCCHLSGSNSSPESCDHLRLKKLSVSHTLYSI